jgi:aspartate racemase
VYAIPLLQRGIAWESIDQATQDQMDELILDYQAGNVMPESHAVVAEALRTVRKRGVDGTILGCTELPLMLGHDAEAPDLINPAQLLAEAAVRRAIA